MDATTYAGAGGTSTINNSDKGTVGFQPDLIWVKSRTDGGSHVFQDSNRGVGSATKLSSNSTNAENNASADATDPIYGYITAITTTGFTAYAGTTPSQVNKSGQNYVAWQWVAGQGVNNTNTVGSITSTVSANTTTGFSIVTYTGTGTTGTVGHGLSTAPSMMIVKTRNQADSWLVYHIGCPNPATNTLILNSTGAVQTSSPNWNSLAPTSSVINVYNPGSGGYSNGNGYTYVAYCWAPVAGFSQFGSYAGNGSTDGTFVYTGFRPKFIMIKCYTAAFGWVMLDSSRNTFNVTNYKLGAESSNAEYQGVDLSTDFLSNGFKLRYTDPAINASGQSYIYMAFAENPTKFANAR
jgi:hypothetical protein